MAYGEFGGLLPRESSYGSPAAYLSAAKAEAYKRASYLSEMDQFYKELEESTRRFDEQLVFNEKQLASQEKMHVSELDLKRELGLGELAYKNRAASLQYDLGMDEIGLKERQLDQEDDWMGLQEDLLERTWPYTERNLQDQEQEFSLSNETRRLQLQRLSETESSEPGLVFDPSRYQGFTAADFL